MKKLLLYLSVLIACTGCPMYDPPSGIIKIKNKSTETVYVYLSCDDTLSESSELKLTWSMGDNAYDEFGNKIKDTVFYPPYRIEPDSIGELRVLGTPNKPRIDCNGKYFSMFFIPEKVMQQNNWKIISRKGLYRKRIKFTQQELDSLKWVVNYSE